MESKIFQRKDSSKTCNFSPVTSCILNFIGFSYILPLVLVGWGYNSFQDINFDYSALLVNWALPVITNISVGSNYTCPADVNYVSAYQWGGTENGCNCSNVDSSIKSSNNWANVSKGSCSEAQLQNNCTNLAAMAAQNMPLWVNNTVWCVERAPYNTFINRSTLTQSDGSCSPGFQRCGYSINGSLDNVFCTSSSLCPITSFAIGQTPPGPTYLESVPFPTSQGSGYNLYWARNDSTSLPVSDFRVSEGQVCLNPTQKNLNSSHNEYLLAANGRTSCSEYDSRYTLIDSTSEKSFFYNNLLLLDQTLPDYTLSVSIPWNLYSRNIIPFKLSCRSMFLNLVGTSLSVDEAKTQTNTAFLAIVWITGFYVALDVVWVIFSLICVDYADMYDKRAKLILIIVNMCMRIAILGVSAEGYRKSRIFVEAFEYVNGRDCSDSYTNSFFNGLYSDFYWRVILIFLVLFCYEAVFFLLDALILILVYLLPILLLRKQETKYKEENSGDASKRDLKNESSNHNPNNDPNPQGEAPKKPEEKPNPRSFTLQFEPCEIELTVENEHIEPHDDPVQPISFIYLNKK